MMQEPAPRRARGGRWPWRPGPASPEMGWSAPAARLGFEASWPPAGGVAELEREQLEGCVRRRARRKPGSESDSDVCFGDLK